MSKVVPFVGRKNELEKLTKLYSNSKAKLVTITGRRRIGKSRLVEEFSKNVDHFIELQGLAPAKGITKEDQILAFLDQLAVSQKKRAFRADNWSEAFTILNESLPQNKKTLILIDEISWLASSSPDFVSRIKIAWDTLFSKRQNLVLIFCGSVSSWIEDNILNSTDFVGRIDLSIHLEELPLDTIRNFWPKNKNTSSFEIFKMISIIGTVPRYLTLINSSDSAEQNIQRLCFEKDGFFQTEFEKIFSDIFDTRATIYKKILHLVLDGKRTQEEIIKGLKLQKNGVISKYLNELVLSGFLAKDISFKPDGQAMKSSRYRLKDNSTRFYLKYISPKKGKHIGVKLIDHLPEWASISGLQFENLILNNQELIWKKLNIESSNIISSSPYFQTKTTKNKGSCQIDLLILTKDHCFYLCEFKFKKMIDKSICKEIDKKVSVFQRPKYTSLQTILIYVGEIDDEVYQTQSISHFIDAADFL